MRLLGYPAEKITILTTYAGQRALVKDVLSHRCARNPVFGMPKAVATVDKYQGEQNDYIILSLTRTSRVGYLRDVRRMTVALSRARFGLYILGRREVFEACPELRPAFDLLLQRPDKLMLVTGELWPTQREVTQELGAVEGEVPMEGVEHLGQYVFEMTNTKIKQLEAEQGGLPETIMEEPEDEEGGMAIMKTKKMTKKRGSRQTSWKFEKESRDTDRKVTCVLFGRRKTRGIVVTRTHIA
ncbi:hypothetical protein NW765_014880 [Fusarium oxysporum]|nr:hypothetical protein NW765_014880 [Fusarium oxysporum]